LGGTITAAGGTLDIGNAISSGLILTIGTTAASVLKLDGSVTSASAITITNANQTLEIGAAGALTIGVAENVTLVTIKLDGGTLNDVNIISFGSGTSNGTLSGFGMVAADLARVGTGINNKITAAGGTLDLAGKFGAGLVAVINAGSDLKFDNVAASNAAIGITLGTQTLEIGASGALTISAIESITNGTIKLDGGSLTDTSGLTIGSAANLIGAGIISTGAADFEGAGTVTAFAGVLDFTTAANLSGAATAYHIADAIGSDLRFDSTVGTGTLHPTITFDSSATGGLGTLDLTHTTLGSFHATVDQFVFGDAIDVLHADHLTLTGGTTLNVFNAANASLGSITLGESHAGANFFVNDSGAITTDQPCYAAGTRILTATGERMVESLMKGDIVLTLAGGELSAQPVKWIGQRRIDLTAHPRPETAVPICIRRGAFAENIPHRDLLLSPDHAVFVDGKLICARQLINGSTIRQETGRASVEYFHVELDVHAILLAEGLPAESYLNTGNRGFFANSGEPLVLHPDLTDESDYPTRAAGSCAPFVSDEASVRPVWQRLAERAAALGQPAPTPDTTSDPELCIVAKGRTVRPLYGENGLYIFALPKGATEVRLVSRSGSPADARPWLDDRRRLGVNVERILLRGASELRELPVDHPGLSQGWQAVERDGTALRRWTSGDAVLPLPALVGPAMLEIRAGNGGMTYLTSTDEERRAA
jgi:Hint domain